MRSFLLRLFLPVLVACSLASGAAAATLEGVTVPDTYTVDGRTLVLNGSGVRTLTIFKIRAYVAALYLPQRSHDAAQILAADEPRVILLTFLRDASKARVEKQFRAGEATNCGHGGCAPADAADFDRLVAAVPAVSRGDTSTYIFTADRVRVFANTRLIGDFANKDLAYHLLAGFIGDHPPSQQLRRQLLGLPDE
ncbi:MAG TPA: chalcone isomerase family protein [Rhodopila sp.]